jgi:hypothetical protein
VTYAVVPDAAQNRPRTSRRMDDIALLSPTERAEIFQQTANRKSISSAVAMEKDYWVCWILRRLFDSPLVDGMVFKGGTHRSRKSSTLFSVFQKTSISQFRVRPSASAGRRPHAWHLAQQARSPARRHASSL